METVPFFTPKQLMERLNVSERTVRKLLARGAIPSYKVGSSVRVDPADFEQYLKEQRNA